MEAGYKCRKFIKSLIKLSTIPKIWKHLKEREEIANDPMYVRQRAGSKTDTGQSGYNQVLNRLM